MLLRDAGLLGTLLGLPELALAGLHCGELDAYAAATSEAGRLALRKAWQAHATSYVCAPWGAGSSGVLLESAHDSMPHGIPAANFVTLMMALTDAPDWQAWQLSDCLDEHCTGLLGCAQFALAVTLLCAGLSGRQAAAMYAYAPHIARVFTGPRAGSAFSGLSCCWELLGLPPSSLTRAAAALKLDLLVVPRRRHGGSSRPTSSAVGAVCPSAVREGWTDAPCSSPRWACRCPAGCAWCSHSSAGGRGRGCCSSAGQPAPGDYSACGSGCSGSVRASSSSGGGSMCSCSCCGSSCCYGRGGVCRPALPGEQLQPMVNSLGATVPTTQRRGNLIEDTVCALDDQEITLLVLAAVKELVPCSVHRECPLTTPVVMTGSGTAGTCVVC